MEQRKSLNLAQKSLNEVLKGLGKKKSKEPCPVCENELYFNDELSKKCALLNENNFVVGWICPHCRSEFDNDDNIIEIFTGIQGKGES